MLALDYTIWLNEAKANKAGLCPLSLRLTLYGRRSEVSTKVRCRPEQWDSVTHRLHTGRGAHPQAKAFNQTLEILEGKVVLLRATLPNTTTLAGFRAALQPPPPAPVPDALALLATASLTYANHSTRATATSALNKLRSYLPTATLPLPALTKAFVADFAAWAQTGRGYTTCLNALRSLYSRACPDLPNPFSAVPFKVNVLSRPRYVLSREQIAAMAALELPGTREQLARDIYLTQYYLHGSRLGVVLELNWAQVEWGTGRVRFKAEKGGDWHNVALRPALAAILRRHLRPEGLVFPLLPDDFAQLDGAVRYQLRKAASAQVWRGLQVIGQLLELPGRLHSHTARHTLATHTVQATKSFHTAQEFLGHKSLAMTEKYVRSMLPDELDSAADTVYGN